MSTEAKIEKTSAEEERKNFELPGAGPGTGRFFSGQRKADKDKFTIEGKCSGGCSGSCK